MLPYLAGRPVNLHRFPDGVDQAGLLAQGRARARARLDRPAGTTTTPTRARPRSTSSSTRRPSLAWVANYGAIELHPWTSTVDDAAPADLGDDRHRSRRAEHVVRRRADAGRGCTAPRSSTSACRPARRSRGQRGIQIWVPVAERYTFDETRAWVEKLSRTIGAVVPELVSWEWEVADRGRQGPARLHPERDQQDAGRAVQPAARAGRAGVGADHVGRARRPRSATRSLEHRHHR